MVYFNSALFGEMDKLIFGDSVVQLGYPQFSIRTQKAVATDRNKATFIPPSKSLHTISNIPFQF